MKLLKSYVYLIVLLAVKAAYADTTTICNSTEACAEGEIGASTIICKQNCPDTNCSLIQACAQGTVSDGVIFCSQCQAGMACPASVTIVTSNGDNSGPTFSAGGSRTSLSSTQVALPHTRSTAQSLGIITKPILFDPVLPPLNSRLIYTFTPSKGPADGKELTLYLYNELDGHGKEQVVSLYAQLNGQKPVTVKHLSAVNRTITKLSELYEGSKIVLSPDGNLLIYRAPHASSFFNIEKALSSTAPTKGTP